VAFESGGSRDPRGAPEDPEHRVRSAMGSEAPAIRFANSRPSIGSPATTRFALRRMAVRISELPLLRAAAASPIRPRGTGDAVAVQGTADLGDRRALG
jgi:hypothetical protein